MIRHKKKFNYSSFFSISRQTLLGVFVAQGARGANKSGCGAALVDDAGSVNGVANAAVETFVIRGAPTGDTPSGGALVGPVDAFFG
jgi:hypothetical protein